MKLCADKIVLSDDGRELLRMLSDGERIAGPWYGIAVQVVEVATIVHAIQDRMRADLPRRTPPHIRDGTVRLDRELAGNTRDDAETVDVVFLGSVAKELHTQADAQDRLRETADYINEDSVPQSLHGIFGRADARQYDAPRRTNRIRVGRQYRTSAKPFEGVQQRGDIRSTAVDDRDAAHGLAQRALGRRQFAAISPDSLPQDAPDRFETGLHHVMRVTARHLDVQGGTQRLA